MIDDYDVEYGDAITVMELNPHAGRLEPRAAIVGVRVANLYTYRLVGDFEQRLLVGLEGFTWVRGHGEEKERALLAAIALS